MKLYLMADRVRFARMTTEELRSTFLVEELFQPGTIQLAYTDLDRAVLGGIVPTGKTHPSCGHVSSWKGVSWGF